MNTSFRSLVLAALCAAFVHLFTGCASVAVNDAGTDMVIVQNSGCYLFCCISLFSGDPNYPNGEVCNWFENTVTLETNIRLLEETAHERNAQGIRNIASHLDDETIIPILLKRKVLRTSAELVK